MIQASFHAQGVFYCSDLYESQCTIRITCSCHYSLYAASRWYPMTPNSWGVTVGESECFLLNFDTDICLPLRPNCNASDAYFLQFCKRRSGSRQSSVVRCAYANVSSVCLVRCAAACYRWPQDFEVMQFVNVRGPIMQLYFVLFYSMSFNATQWLVRIFRVMPTALACHEMQRKCPIALTCQTGL